MKKVFALVCLVLFAFSLAVVGFAHPGGTDGNGGHYVGNPGEYHYHHGYSAHQHSDGVCPYEEPTIKWSCDKEGCTEEGEHYHLIDTDTTKETNKNEFTLPYACVEVDNLEDVLMNEFGDESAEEIRDAIVYISDTELFEFRGTYYVEYESLRDTAMYQCGENITERIFSHPDLIVLTPEDFADKYGEEEYDETPEDDITEYIEEYEYENKEEELTLEQKIDNAIDLVKNIFIGIVIIFLPGILAGVAGFLKDTLLKIKEKKRSRN